MKWIYLEDLLGLLCFLHHHVIGEVCLPQWLEQEHQHAPRTVFCFCIIPALRYLQCCHCLGTPPPLLPSRFANPSFFVLPLVELQSVHNKLIVDENKMAFQVSVLIIWNSNLFSTPFLPFGHCWHKCERHITKNYFKYQYSRNST